jgi:hypothetical protein
MYCLRKKGVAQTKEFRELEKRRRSIPSVVVNDPHFIRIKYQRYADDVRHLTQDEILLAEKKGSEEMTFGPPYLPEGES